MLLQRCAPAESLSTRTCKSSVCRHISFTQVPARAAAAGSLRAGQGLCSRSRALASGLSAAETSSRSRSISSASASTSTSPSTSASTAPGDMAAAHGEGGGIYNFSRDEDPESTEKAARTLGEGMGGKGDNLFCPKPEWNVPRWHAIGHNYTLGSMSKVRMMYALSKDDFRAVSYAYWYPEESGEDPPPGAPPPEGFIDMTQWRRKEAMGALTDLLRFLDEGKEAFLKEKGPFLYVAFLSTLPSVQGNGLGGKLLQHLTAKADAAGKWMFIEATNDRNASLYERNGFVRIEGGTKVWSVPEVPGVEQRLIRMARPPAPKP